MIDFNSLPVKKWGYQQKNGNNPVLFSAFSIRYFDKLAMNYQFSTMIQQKSNVALSESMLICTDGAKFSLRGMIPRQKRGFRKISKDLTIKYRGYGHQTFEDVCEVIYKNNIIGTMEIHPRSLMSPDTVLFSVANRIQYQKGWTELIKEAWSDLELTFTHICRLDIAVDQPYIKQFSFIKDLINGKLIHTGNATFTVEYEKGKDGKPDARYFRFGSRSSDKFLRAYYKRQELAVSNKNYIFEYWERNGWKLGEGQEVARFEIVLKRKELKRYNDIFEKYGELNANSLHLLEDPEYLASLYNTGNKGFFEFVSNRSLARTGNVTRCKRKVILDLSNISTYLLEKIISKVTSDIYKAKVVCKQMFHFACKTLEPRYMMLVDEVLFNFNLRRWFEANREKFYKEYEYKYKSANFQYLKNYTSNPEFVQEKIWKLHEFTL